MNAAGQSGIEIVYYVASSIDGRIATPDGGVAWLARFEGTDEDYGYAAFYAGIDAVLMGSRTYEQTLRFAEWPFAGKPTVVFSARSLPDRDGEVTVTRDLPGTVVDRLAREGARRVWLVGGGELAASFRARGLLTEAIVSIIPVILGAGIPLFASSGNPEPLIEPLEVTDSRRYPSGLVQIRARFTKSGEEAPDAR